ncbi:hypothetical protein BGZ61DRAFT_85043 [Ilyonectria robusta]|uniref:uncharacterized protein n=1 Tax=Ilyonectria robusta TaxID=1079257 RepID=UPI001E8DAC7D|nr:uncharacterized protein BGZ61DRAFT_85043 [Ilyonectria robusta]KAH8735764.1 hypothetical protein BGZ61DRAFT_85043 [Ilyonectria robusta]
MSLGALTGLDSERQNSSITSQPAPLPPTHFLWPHARLVAWFEAYFVTLRCLSQQVSTLGITFLLSSLSKRRVNDTWPKTTRSLCASLPTCSLPVQLNAEEQSLPSSPCNAVLNVHHVSDRPFYSDSQAPKVQGDKAPWCCTSQQAQLTLARSDWPI